MKFNPYETNNSLVEGKAKYLVIQAEEQISKSGSNNEMLKLKLKVTQPGGKSGYLYDYLVASDGCVWKISNFCKASGNAGKYKEGELTPEMIKGWSGECTLKLEKSPGFDEQMKLSTYDFNEESSFKDDEDLPF